MNVFYEKDETGTSRDQAKLISRCIRKGFHRFEVCETSLSIGIATISAAGKIGCDVPGAPIQNVDKQVCAAKRTGGGTILTTTTRV